MFLVTVHNPICTELGDLHAALYGSFLPVPSSDVFPAVDWSPYAIEKAPGAIVVKDEKIVLNKGRDRVQLKVTNNGDRPIQVCTFINKLLLAWISTDCPNRLARITTSSKPIPLYLSIAGNPTENGWISQQVLLSVSNPET